jgi:hypothetical protein
MRYFLVLWVALTMMWVGAMVQRLSINFTWTLFIPTLILFCCDVYIVGWRFKNA